MRLPSFRAGPRRRACPTRFVNGALVALFMLVTPGVAFAHGRLKSSSPSAGAHLGTVPRELRFEFSEVPELSFSKVRLLGPGGRTITLGALAYAAESKRTVIAAIPGALAAGTYVVEWQLAGDDGHPVRGRFDFVVAPGAMGATLPELPEPGASATAMSHDPASMPEGAGFGAESPAYVVVRWTQFMALLIVVGAVSFRQFVLAFLRRKKDPDSPLFDVAERRTARVARVAVGALAVTLALRLFAQSYAMHGAGDAWNFVLSLQMVQHTTWGKGWLLQLAGVVAAGLGFHFAGRARFAWPLATLGAVMLAFSPAFSGHAAASPKLPLLAVLADGFHVLAASSWLGSLALVLIAGLPAALQLDEAERGTMVAALISSFSPVALTSAALAASTGVFAAWLHVGLVPNLWGTRYGVTLLVKLAILGIVSLTGFYNWRFVKPRLGTTGATLHLRRSAAMEVVVAVLVLLVTAILVATPTSMEMEM